MAQRPYADRGAVDLIALLAEHCTHPQAHVIAAELELRVVFLAGKASGHPDFAGFDASTMLCGIGVSDSPTADGDEHASDIYESGDLTGGKPL